VFHTVTFYNDEPPYPLFAPGPKGLYVNNAIIGPANLGVPVNKDLVFNSGLMLNPKDVYTITIGQIQGKLPYVCAVHPGQIGELVVE
jgi:plastocyanin